MRKVRNCWEEKKPLCLYKGKSYINEEINSWKVLSYHSTKEKPSGSRVDWLCKCLSCNSNKVLPMYNVISGRSKRCSTCANKNKNGDKNNNWKGVGHIPSSVITKIKNGAKSRNINFDVDGYYLNTIWLQQNNKCALTGLTLEMRSTRTSAWENSASLDRIDSHFGYVEGNIRWVHPIVNIMKNQFDDKTFISMCEKVVDYNKNLL